MAAGDIRVDPDALRRHATSVDRAGDAVQAIRDTARTVDPGRAAHGRLPICQAVPDLTNPVQAAALDALREAVDVLHDTADVLRDTAGTYADSDSRASYRFQGKGL